MDSIGDIPVPSDRQTDRLSVCQSDRRDRQTAVGIAVARTSTVHFMRISIVY